MRGSHAALLLLGVALAPTLRAQDSAFRSIDRIVAVVGTTPIMLTRLEEEVNILRQEGMQVPEDPAQLTQLMGDLLQQIIQEELLVQQALRDTTVQVPDQQVQSAVDEVLRQVRSQFPTELEFRRQLQLAGFGSPEEYRRFFLERRRREMLVQALLTMLQQRQDIRPVPPTEEEMRAFFDATSAQQPRRPATVTFRILVVRPQPQDTAVATARTRADSIRAALMANDDEFPVLARRFSHDSASAAQGGALGWLRRGVTVREFEDVIFRLRVGAISPVFRSPFGFHIAQVERSEPSEVQVRHILISPEVTAADRAAALDTATVVATALQNGVALDSLVRRYHDPLEQSLFESVARDDLYPSLQAALEGATVDQVIGPIELTEGGRQRYGVILFQEERPEGEYQFDEVREAIRSQLAERQMYARYVESLRRNTYVEIRLQAP